MDRTHRRILARWREIRWSGWWGDYLDVRFELPEAAGTRSGERVLDVGCGPGILLPEFDATSIRVGIDQSPGRLAVAKSVAPGSLLVRADMEHLPFRDGVFDVVVLAGVWEGRSDKARFLRGIGRIVVHGGRILATTPNVEHWQYRDNPWLRRLEEVDSSFSVFRRTLVQGYNPLPSYLVFLPGFIKRRIPPRCVGYLFVPSWILLRLPGIEAALRALMRVRRLRRRCKSFLVLAEK